MLRGTSIMRAAAAGAATTLYSGEVSLVKESDNVARLIMNRPSRKNAISMHFLDEMQKCLHLCRTHAEIRCLVVESQVKGVFCAGADLKERKEMSIESSHQFVNSLRDVFCELEDLAMPTISAMDGAALGGGCELSLCTDLRIAGESVRIGLPETGWAIIPGAGGTFRAPSLIGVSRALQLIFTADPIDARTAQSFGLVNEVVPSGAALERSMELARRIARNGPLAIAAAKRAVRNGYGKPREEGLAVERRESASLTTSKDRVEGLMAFAEKRKPNYKGH